MRNHQTLASILVLTLCFIVPPSLAEAADPVDDPLRPSPDHAVAQVVLFQLTALQEAGQPDAAEERGMATVFAFASPANRAQTGPLERFDAMVRQPPYAVLVGHARHNLVEMMWIDANGQITDDPDAAVLAHALVVIDNPPAGEDQRWFMWVLSKQADEPYAGCWMTEMVTPVEPPATPDPPAEVV